MLILKLKKGKRVFVGAGQDQVIVSVHNVEIRTDGTVDIQLGFNADKHVPIDREKVRDQKISRFQHIMDK